MRCWAFPVVCLLPVAAFCAPREPVVTVVLRVEGSAATRTMDAMRTEIEHILADSGLSFEFRDLQNVKTHESFGELIVVKLKGKCEMDFNPVAFDERGPEGFAFTHTSDGAILPFSEVPCDRVRAAVRTAMWGDDYRRGNELLGRALGRILAHEFYHILGKTKLHGRAGVAKHAFSPADLIADELRLDGPDANLIRLRMAAVETGPRVDLP